MFTKSIGIAVLALSATSLSLATTAQAQSFGSKRIEVTIGAPVFYNGHRSSAPSRVVDVRFRPGIGQINQRIRRQAKRIRRGRRDGSLTRSEYRYLQFRLDRIRHNRVRAARNGRVTGFERWNINRQLNVNSRRIKRLRHNRATAYNRYSRGNDRRWDNRWDGRRDSRWDGRRDGRRNGRRAL